MVALPGVTPSSRSGHQTSGMRKRNDMYVMNQFSIYRNNPIVSARVANESALAAHLANNWYLEGAVAHNLKCKPAALQRCMGISFRNELLRGEEWHEGTALNWQQCLEPKLGACENF